MTLREMMYHGAVLKPNYTVTLEKKGRAHYYKVTGKYEDGGEFEKLLPGVTGTLHIIGGEKMDKLIGWSKKHTLKRVQEELMKIGGPVLMEPHIIEDIISKARKESGTILDAAADYGTRLHDHCDRVINGLPTEPEDDLKNSVLAFQDWFRESGLEMVMGDTAVASLKHGYGGKFDAVAVNKAGEYVLIDFKTSSGCREEYALQVAAYAEAFFETYWQTIRHAIIVRFDKETPTYEIKVVKDIPKAFEGFLAAQRLKSIVTGELYQ